MECSRTVGGRGSGGAAYRQNPARRRGPFVDSYPRRAATTKPPNLPPTRCSLVSRVTPFYTYRSAKRLQCCGAPPSAYPRGLTEATAPRRSRQSRSPLVTQPDVAFYRSAATLPDAATYRRKYREAIVATTTPSTPPPVRSASAPGRQK